MDHPPKVFNNLTFWQREDARWQKMGQGPVFNLPRLYYGGIQSHTIYTFYPTGEVTSERIEYGRDTGYRGVYRCMQSSGVTPSPTPSPSIRPDPIDWGGK